MDSEEDNKKNVNTDSNSNFDSDLKKEVDMVITKEQTFQVAKLLGDTIDNFLKKIPTDKENYCIRKQLKRLITSISYTAPEIICQKWFNLYSILCDQIIVSLNTQENPNWKNEIVNDWQTANKDYNDIFNST
jgi:hypothetical protein